MLPATRADASGTLGNLAWPHVFNDSGYRCAAWSPDGKILARGGADVLLWTSDPDDPHKVFHPDAEVAKLAWGAITLPWRQDWTTTKS